MILTRLTRATAIAGLALAAIAAKADAPADPGTVLARVNGAEITLGHVVALRSRLPAQYQQLPDDVLMEGILEQLIQQSALAQAIEGAIDLRMTLALENDRRAYLASQMIERISEAEVSEQEIQVAYLEAIDGFVPDPEYNASHILVPTEQEAQEILGLLEEGADFAELARERSQDPGSGPNGGTLGWFSAGMMVQPFDEAVMAMAVGEVAGPVRTQFGFHVIRLDDMREGAPPALDEVRPQIAMQLQRQRFEQALAELMEAAEIERPELDLDPAVIRDGSMFDR